MVSTANEPWGLGGGSVARLGVLADYRRWKKKIRLAVIADRTRQRQADWQKETGNVCGCESEDFESNKSAVGKV
jgi:hypothetical protein